MSADRRSEGQIILNKGNEVRRIDAHSYKVKSQSNTNKEYDVTFTELGAVCSCPDQRFRGVKCKHVFAVEFSLALQ